jgi:hypothetical protein
MADSGVFVGGSESQHCVLVSSSRIRHGDDAPVVKAGLAICIPIKFIAAFVLAVIGAAFAIVSELPALVSLLFAGCGAESIARFCSHFSAYLLVPLWISLGWFIDVLCAQEERKVSSKKRDAECAFCQYYIERGLRTIGWDFN